MPKPNNILDQLTSSPIWNMQSIQDDIEGCLVQHFKCWNIIYVWLLCNIPTSKMITKHDNLNLNVEYPMLS
jgi:hypothetical protein